MKADFRSLCSLGAALFGASVLVTGAQAADAVAGKALYLTKCKTCHGAEGTPPPAMVKTLGVKPLNDPATQAKTDAALKDAILKGIGKMKPVAVSPAEADDMVAVVRSMK